MLPKPQRINLKKEFKVIASGQRVEDEYFKLFLKAGSNDQVKIGISVAKSGFKNAVQRNRARRLISAGVESLYKDFPNKMNLIIMPKSESLKLTPDEVKGNLVVLLKRIGVF